MKLLTDSYGHGMRSGVWISLQTDRFDTERAKEAFIGFGCCETRLPKIFGLLTTSGRYDCCVQSAWIKRQWLELVRQMAAAGIRVVTDPYYMPVFADSAAAVAIKNASHAFN